MTKVKVCGMTNLADAEHAIGRGFGGKVGADYAVGAAARIDHDLLA